MIPGPLTRAFTGLGRWAEPFVYDGAAELLRLRRRVGATVTVDLGPDVDRPPAGRVLLVRSEHGARRIERPVKLQVVGGSPGYWVGDGRFVPRALDEGPRFAGLYDERGDLIPGSTIRRGRDQALTTVTRPRLPDDFKIVEEPVIYVGPAGRHFGHFITESVARLWYALDVRPDLRIVLERRGPVRPIVAQYLSALGIPESRLVSPTVPTRFVEAHVPEPTWIAGALVYERHVEMSRAVTRGLLRDDVPRETDQPLYLARTHLGSRARGAYGERPLLRQMTKHGARVVHPQELDFAQQVRLVNAHRTIVGQLGAAHHLSLFALQPRHHVYFCNGPWANYVMLDHALGNRAHYLACNRSVRSTRHRRGTITDVPFALAQLRELGLLPRRSA